MYSDDSYKENFFGFLDYERIVLRKSYGKADYFSLRIRIDFNKLKRYNIFTICIHKIIFGGHI